MNMIPTGAFLTEMDASEKKETLAEQFVSIWEKKNSKIARAGGVSLMALSLAACGSSSDDTAATETPAAETPAEETPAAETPAEETPAEEEVVEEVSPVATELAVATLTADTTMKTTDDLDGGAGTADELSLSLSADFAGFVVDTDAADTGSMVGYEVVSLSADALARSFDATGVSGVETYKIDGSNGGVASIADSADLAAIELSNIASGAFSITYAAPTGGTSPVAGTADTLDLTVEGLGSATADIAITAAGVETLAVTSNAAASAAGATNYLDTASVGAATVTVGGAADTDFGAVSTSTTSFDASAATGAITAALGNAGDSALTSVKTGSGDDSVTADLNDLGATATVDMGDGADTLTLTSTATETFQLKMSGVETINATDLANGTTATLSLSDTTGLTTVDVGAATGLNDFGTATLALVNASGDLTVNATGETGAGTVSTDTTGAVTINVAADAKATALTGDAATAIFVADKASSLTLNVSGLIEQTGNISADKATSVTVTTGAEDHTNIFMDAAKAETLTITAGADADFTADATDGLAGTTSTFSGAKVITASSAGTTLLPAFAAANTVDLSGAGADATITTGNLGAATLANNITATASGLKSGVTLGTVQTAGAATVDFSAATGANTVGAITTTGAATVTAGAGAATIGKIDASAVTVDLTASSTSTTFNDGAGLVDIVSGSTVDITSNAIAATSVDIDGDKTSLTVTATGGLAADIFDITNSTAAGFTGFTVSGDLGLGANEVNITVTDAALAAGASGTPSTTVDVSGVDNATITVSVDNTFAASDTLTVTGTKDTNSTDIVSFTAADSFEDVTLTNVDQLEHALLNINASAVSGKTIGLKTNANGDDLVLNGGAGADTINVSSFTTVTAGNVADNVIFGGAKGDTITLHATIAANDSIVYTAQGEGSAVGSAGGTFSGFDVITNFDDAGTDTVRFDSNKDDGNTDIDALATAVDAKQVVAQTAAVTASNDLADADYTDVDAVIAFINDSAVVTGVAAGELDIVAITFSDFSAIYAVDNAAGAAVIAGEVELLATIDEVVIAGDIVIA